MEGTYEVKVELEGHDYMQNVLKGDQTRKISNSRVEKKGETGKSEVGKI